MPNLYRTPEGVFYQEENGKQIPITDPNTLRNLYSGKPGLDFTEKPIITSTIPKTIPNLGTESAAGITNQTPSDPLSKFSDSLINMLKKAQTGELDTTQQQVGMKKEMYGSILNNPVLSDQGLRPSDRISSAVGTAKEYEPGISILDKKLNQIRDFTTLLKDTYADDWSKLVPPSENEIKTMRAALRAGRNLTQDEVQRYSKYLTEDDWNLWAEQNRKGELANASISEPMSYKEWALAGGLSETGKTYNEWMATGGGRTKQLPSTQLVRVADFQNTLDSWNAVKQLGKEIESAIGPTKIFNYKGSMQNFARQYKDKRLSVLLSETEKAFQLYRKETTGAQASDKELQLLRPNLPSITESPAVFFAKVDKTMEGTRRAKNALLNTYAKAGYDVEAFLEPDTTVNTNQGQTSNKTTTNGTSSNVLMVAPDGTIGNVPQSEVARLTKLGYKLK